MIYIAGWKTMEDTRKALVELHAKRCKMQQMSNKVL